MNKEFTLRVRLSRDEKTEIERAAKALDRKVSSFIRFAAVSLAKKVKSC